MSQTDPHKIFILEKNQSRRDYLRSIVLGRGHLPIIFEKETICLDNLLSLQPDLVISGPLSQNRMYRFVNTIKMMDGGLPVLIISGDTSIKDYADSNGFGDVKLVNVNFEPSEIKGTISSLIRKRYADFDFGDQETPLIIGNSPEMLKIKKRIFELKDLNEPILIQGEPGTGKELVAKAVHHQSVRCNSPFTKLNMAEFKSEMLNNIICNFGEDGYKVPHQRRSADEHPMHAGTLLLDEIALLSVADQARLLAVFEAGCFSESRDQQKKKNSAPAAIVVTSSSYLDHAVIRGKFRKDLYYRISVVSLNIPPLRDRIDDIPLLADFFGDKLCMEYGAGPIELSKKIKEGFCRYPWPGNVSELKSIVQRAVLYGEQDSVIQDFAAYWAKRPNLRNPDENSYAHFGLSKLKKYLEGRENPNLKRVRNHFLKKTEKAIIKKALEMTNWNRKKAAKMLEISYKSLLNKIKEYELAD